MRFLLTGITIAIALTLATAPSLSTITPVFAQSHDNLVEQINTQSAEEIEDGSLAINFARNLAEFIDSSFNTLTQTNDQSIEDVSDKSIAANIGINNVEFGGTDGDPGGPPDDGGGTGGTPPDDGGGTGGTPPDDGGGLPPGSGAEDPIGDGTGDGGSGSDNNEVSQSNDQDIEDVSKGSEAANIGINNAEFENSDNNDVSQSNEQEIEDVDDDSSASNNAGNSVSFDDGEDGRSPPNGGGEGNG